MNDIIERAKKEASTISAKRGDNRYRRSIAWLGYTGLLRHSEILPMNNRLHLSDLLFAANIEPRVRELLPAILVQLRGLLPFKTDRVPADLANVIQAQEAKTDYPSYQNISVNRYGQWFNSPAIKLARKRLAPHAKPRLREGEAHDLAKTIKRVRVEMGFTQKHFCQTFQTSLRALRDLEQGRTHVSIERVNAILNPLRMELAVRTRGP